MTDGTYRLTKSNYILLVLATQDSNHKIHPICFNITYIENERSYTCLFEHVRKYYNS